MGIPDADGGYIGRSICGGKEVVVAVDIDTAGELLEARTTFFSCWPCSSQRSTERTKKDESISLQLCQNCLLQTRTDRLTQQVPLDRF